MLYKRYCEIVWTFVCAFVIIVYCVLELIHTVFCLLEIILLLCYGTFSLATNLIKFAQTNLNIRFKTSVDTRSFHRYFWHFPMCRSNTDNTYCCCIVSCCHIVNASTTSRIFHCFIQTRYWFCTWIPVWWPVRWTTCILYLTGPDLKTQCSNELACVSESYRNWLQCCSVVILIGLSLTVCDIGVCLIVLITCQPCATFVSFFYFFKLFN